MTNIVPSVDTSPTGRHGRIGVDTLPRDIEYPSFDRPYVEQGLAAVATNAAESAPTVEPTKVRPVAQKPIDPHAEIWR